MSTDNSSPRLSAEQETVAQKLFKRAAELRNATGFVDEHSLAEWASKDRPLSEKCRWLWEQLLPNLEWSKPNIVLWLEVICHVAVADEPKSLFDRLYLELEKRIVSVGRLGAATPSTSNLDTTSVDANRLANHAGCGSRKIRDTLTNCNRVADGRGRSGHQWRYCDALPILRDVNSGCLKSVVWPDSETELANKKDSNKIPARKSKR